jgi:hypothetical protein
VLQIECLGGTARLVSDAGLLAGYAVTAAGPGPEVRVGLLGVDVVVVNCSSGSPTVSLGLM